MNLQFNISLPQLANYKSPSQYVRVLTEDWATHNLYCPVCGEPMLEHYSANRPVADFCCPQCQSDFELKSKENRHGDIGNKVTDGEYNTMIGRIHDLNNPNFFFMTYYQQQVNSLLFVPNYFFVNDVIEKRKPLADTARRAGWIGCNILVSAIPDSGKIFMVKQGQEVEQEQVLHQYQRIVQLQTHNLESRGWLLDTLKCVEQIPTDDFSLDQMYAFAKILQRKHPSNNFVRDKIRQQLQLLRDKGFIEFTKRGYYRKIK